MADLKCETCYTAVPEEKADLVQDRDSSKNLLEQWSFYCPNCGALVYRETSKAVADSLDIDTKDVADGETVSVPVSE